MFASLFRKQTSARMSRCGSPRRARLAVESLEDRTVPTTMMSNLGSVGDTAHLCGGAMGGVDYRQIAQVSVSAGEIDMLGRATANSFGDSRGTDHIGEEIPQMLGGAGVQIFPSWFSTEEIPQ